MRRALPLLLVLVAMPLPAETIYRWVDANGGVHYSATPPPGQAAEARDVRVNRAASPAATAETTAEPRDGAEGAAESTARPEVDPAEEAAREAEYQAARQRNCEAARRNIERLVNEPARRYQQPDGSFRKYGNDELESRLAEARAAEAENCD
jgi:hypothetical protein